MRSWACWALRTALKARRQSVDRPLRPGGALLADTPWLQDVFAAGSGAKRPRHEGAAHGRRPVEPNNDAGRFAEDPQPALVEAEDIFDELQKRRALWAAQHEDDLMVHFATRSSTRCVATRLPKLPETFAPPNRCPSLAPSASGYMGMRSASSSAVYGLPG